MSSPDSSGSQASRTGDASGLAVSFALGDGLFVGGVALFATTITPLYDAGRSAVGLILTIIAGAILLVSGGIARRKFRLVSRSAVQVVSGAFRPTIALYGLELLTFALALCLLFATELFVLATALAVVAGFLLSWVFETRYRRLLTAGLRQNVAVARPLATSGFALR